MNKLERLRNIDHEIFDEFKSASKHLPYLLNESNYPYTTEVCFMFMNGTNFLKNSIFDCAENDDFYSVNVLFRSIIEHFLRFKYFWFNHAPQKNDSYAFKYRTAIDLMEKIEIEKSMNAVKQIANIKTDSFDDIWNILVAKNKDFEKFTKSEIVEFSKTLSIKNIIRFIERELKKGDFPANDFLQKIIIQYSLMSSFVHGGLYAHKKMVSLENDIDRQEKLIAICGLALQNASFIKLFSFLTFYQFMPEFGIHYNKTNELIIQINNYR